MAKKKKHKGADPRIQTAEGWRRMIRRETGKKVYVVPGQGSEQA